jgi:hypothetical protein
MTENVIYLTAEKSKSAIKEIEEELFFIYLSGDVKN